jgi:sialidase-1
MGNIERTLKTDSQILFEKGVNNSFNYRIPSIITTNKGTVIATIDARVDEPGDNPNNIDKVIRRSFDNGVTWGDVQLLVDYPGKGRKEGAAAIDPAMLEDRETNTIWMIFCHTPGGIGLWNSEPGVGFTPDGYKKLYDKDSKKYILGEEGRVYDSNGQKTDMIVDNHGYVYRENKKLCNIYLNEGELLEERTSFLQIIHSNDDGKTWSEPVDLNLQVKESWMKFIGSGPGIGIQMTKSEKYKGRLVFPIYFSNSSHSKMSCAVIYSDDHGKTWNRGESPNDGRVYEGKTYDAENLDNEELTLTECQLIELPNGDLKFFMRNHNSRRRTAIAISKDGGESWGEVTFHETLIDPICQSSVIKYPDLGDGKCRVIFSNPADEKERKNGTVRYSEDGGETWLYSKVLQPGDFWYSCLTVLPDNNIGILYETNECEDTKNVFTSFSLEWLTTGDN